MDKKGYLVEGTRELRESLYLVSLVLHSAYIGVVISRLVISKKLKDLHRNRFLSGSDNQNTRYLKTHLKPGYWRDSMNDL